MSYQVLARKWRPRDFSAVVGQEPILRALSNALQSNRLHHAYLFTGTRGVGKTTIARILAKCLNCETGPCAIPCGQCGVCQDIDQGRFIDLIEVDAASRTKVEDTRELLDNVQYAPSRGRFKIYLIDEVHMLSQHSFNALLKTLEEPPAHVKFLLATTDPDRLPVTVLSRCLQFHLKRLTPEMIAQHLQTILQAENITFEPLAIDHLSRAAEGSVRDGLSLLDQAIAFCQGNITQTQVQAMLGVAGDEAILQLLEVLLDQNTQALLQHIAAFAETAVDFSQALEDLISLLHHLAIAHATNNTEMLWHNKSIQHLVKKIAPADIQVLYQIGLLGRRDLHLINNTQESFEMVLLRMLLFQPQLVTPSEKHFAAPTTKTTEPVITSAPVVATPVIPTEPVATKKAEALPVDPNTLQWSELIPNLGLTGPTLALANNCEVQEFTQTGLQLRVGSQHKALLNDMQVKRLEAALQQHLQRPIKVKIEVQKIQAATPAILAEQAHQVRLQAAEQTLLQDAGLQALLQTFGTELSTEGIKLRDDKV